VRTAGAGIEHARSKADDDRAYLGRKPSCAREQFATVRDMLGQAAVDIAGIAQEVGLSRQAVYRIKDDPAGAEAALAAWGL
jgi:DNA invertase Pin-like site-specific DNA recombinase